MRLTPTQQDRFKIVALSVIAATVVVSIIAATLLGMDAARRIKAELSERSQTVAAALHPSDIAALKARSTNNESATYLSLKSRLGAIEAANPDARSIYLMGRTEGRLFFFADSEDPESQYYSSAGEWYEEPTDENRAMFDNGRPLVEGPVTDEYGTFISGLAPVKDSQGNVVAVLGIDFASTKYWHDIILAAAVPLLTGFGVVAVLSIFENIRQRNQQLLALRSELVSVASHELRNPVTGIRWAAESLEKMAAADSKEMPMVRAIKNSAVRLQESTDDILELTHAMNRRKLNQAEIDIAALVREVFEAQALSAQQKGVTLHIDPLWPAQVIVRCDPNQMRRALHNVVSNAIKYTRDNTTVTATYNHDETAHHIFVTDEGIGIPTDEQDKVFKGFYRASNAVASKISGTGLGLFLVQAVLQQHGGSVHCTSQQDKGTTIELTLPKNTA